MAVTLKGRAGASLRAKLSYYTDKSRTDYVDTTGKTARIQFRAGATPNSAGRIIFSALEVADPSPPADTVLHRLEPGVWRLFLGKTQTSQFPPSVRFEIELLDDSNEEDVTFLGEGILKIAPKTVTNPDV